jgi:hypothetical protein
LWIYAIYFGLLYDLDDLVFPHVGFMCLIDLLLRILSNKKFASYCCLILVWVIIMLLIWELAVLNEYLNEWPRYYVQYMVMVIIIIYNILWLYYVVSLDANSCRILYVTKCYAVSNGTLLDRHLFMS